MRPMPARMACPNCMLANPSLSRPQNKDGDNGGDKIVGDWICAWWFSDREPRTVESWTYRVLLPFIYVLQFDLPSGLDVTSGRVAIEFTMCGSSGCARSAL